MALTAGSRIGTYEIGAPLGVGGMGEVYRATDTTLGRAVAIKVLPEAFAHDGERLARFEREAKTLAALNHPNIAQVYGLESADGTRALVMELVEGLTLAERIAAGAAGQAGPAYAGLPLEEALPIATQIADALEAAHEQGIIHRDLKPANIKVREDGTVKVLDFGLAKLVEPGDAEDAPGGPGGLAVLSQSPTITTPAMTQAGVILGTAAYMSPEQAKGRPADKRSDVWAFGAVLYETLTGQRAFEGDDVSDTLASVLKGDPDWTLLPDDLPVAIRTLVQRCLVKDRRKRIGDIAAAQLLLSEYGSLSAATPLARAVEPVPVPWWKRTLPVATAVVLTAAIIGGGAWGLRPAPAPPAPIAQFSIQPPGGEDLTGLGRQSVAISPDGTRLAYVANSRLYVRAITEVDARPIPGMPPDSPPNNPVFSPDGESLAFQINADSTLKRIPVAGGQPLTIAQGVENPTGMTWGEGGIVFAQAEGGVFRVSPNGGAPEQLAAVGGDQVAHGPQILPGGQWVLFTLARSAGADRWDTAEVVVQSLSSGERRTLIKGGSDARYVETGHLLYAVGGTVYAVPFDVSGRTVGEGVVAIAGVRRSTGGATGATQFSVSSNGALLYVPGPLAPTGGVPRIPVLVRRGGRPEPLALPAREYVRPRVSPNGTRLAVGIQSGGDADVWVYELSGASAIRRLTFGGRNRFPVWSPDARNVAFQSDRDGTFSLYVQAADGGGAAERLTTAGQDVSHVPDSWSPDGRTLLFSEQRGATYTLMALSVGDKRASPFAGVESLEAPEAVFSPDGRWVAYAFNKGAGGAVSSDRGIFVQPFPPTGAIYQVPKTRLDFHPAWGPSGREVFYVSTIVAEELTGVSLKLEPNPAFGTPAPVDAVSEPGITSGFRRGYDVLPDGRFITLLAAETTAAGGESEMRVVLNWFEELRRLVPQP